MKDCERFEALISVMLDGELSPGEEAEVRAHMESCPECAAMYRAFAAVGAAVAGQEVPDTLHEGIMEKVRAAERASRTHSRIVRMRTILTAAACLVVLVGTVFALRNGFRMGSAAPKAAADAPMTPEAYRDAITAGGAEAPAAAAAAQDHAAQGSVMSDGSEERAEAAPQPEEPAMKSEANAVDFAPRPPRDAPIAGLNASGAVKSTVYENADAVIADSVLIVRAMKTGEDRASDPPGGSFSLSRVQIEEVLENNGSAAIAEGSVIDVLESRWADGESGTEHHADGYLKMETGRSYLLFLGYDAELGRYYPLGPLYGKIPLDPAEALFADGNQEQAAAVVEELRTRYLLRPGE